MCKHAVYLPLEAKNAVRFVKLYNLVHEGLELLTELTSQLVRSHIFPHVRAICLFLAWLGQLHACVHVI